MDEQIDGWLSSARYAKGAATLASEFAHLEGAMTSTDPQARLRAARRLNDLARSELSWFLLPVREYFLRPSAQQALAGALRIETDGNVRDRMLNALRHASERFVEHPMWSPRSTADEHDAWRKWVHAVTDAFSADSRSSTRAEAAYLLAFCGDPRAWDLFVDLARRRPSTLTLLHDAVTRYPASIVPEQRTSILALADEVGATNPRYEYDAAGIAAALNR